MKTLRGLIGIIMLFPACIKKIAGMIVESVSRHRLASVIAFTITLTIITDVVLYCVGYTGIWNMIAGFALVCAVVYGGINERKRVTQNAGENEENDGKNKKVKFRETVAGSLAILVIALVPVLVVRYGDLHSDIQNEEQRTFAMESTTSQLSYLQYPELIHVADTEFKAGISFFNDGDFKKAIDRFDAALANHNNSTHANKDTARIHYYKGLAYCYLYEHDKAIECYTDALGIIESLEKTPENEYEAGYVKYLRANAYINLRSFEKADRDLSEAVEALETLTALRNQSGFEILYDESATLLTYGNMQLTSRNSSEDFQKQLNSEKLDVTNAVFAYYVYSMGLYYKSNKQSEDGIEFAQTRRYEDDDLESSEVFHDYRFDSLLEEGWKISKTDWTTAELLMGRANACSIFGWYEEALIDLYAVIEIYGELGPSFFNDIYRLMVQAGSTVLKIAILQNGKVDQEEAELFLQMMKRSQKYCLEWKPAGESIPLSYFFIGYAYCFCGKYEKAVKEFEQAKNHGFNTEIIDFIMKDVESGKTPMIWIDNY